MEDSPSDLQYSRLKENSKDENDNVDTNGTWELFANGCTFSNRLSTLSAHSLALDCPEDNKSADPRVDLDRPPWYASIRMVKQWTRHRVETLSGRDSNQPRSHVALISFIVVAVIIMIAIVVVPIVWTSTTDSADTRGWSSSSQTATDATPGGISDVT